KMRRSGSSGWCAIFWPNSGLRPDLRPITTLARVNYNIGSNGDTNAASLSRYAQGWCLAGKVRLIRNRWLSPPY
ncbi:MAG: hypothetical protein AAFQ99_13105, partial [Pseudomonadota bacterium]